MVTAAWASSWARPRNVTLVSHISLKMREWALFTYKFPTSLGARKSAVSVQPPVTMSPFPLVTRTTSLAAAHQLRFAVLSSALVYGISKTAPLRNAVRTMVCFMRNGRRGTSRGTEIICTESGEGCVCVRHASEKVVSVVGARAMISKALKIFECAFVYGMVGQ